MEKQIETECTDLAICPWCGYGHKDSFEFRTGECSCDSCSKPFHVEVETSVSYTTSKLNTQPEDILTVKEK